MIQIIGLRPYTDKNGNIKLADSFYNKDWRVTDIYELFKNAEKYIKQVPDDQHWNLFYTVANCTEDKRVFLKQDVLPIDIDGIEKGTEDKIVDVVCAELQIPKEKLGIVYSGNGVHILIGLKIPITEASYIRTNKVFYRALCGRINTALFENGVAGKADPVVFSEARLLRMPFTTNIKQGKENTTCKLIGRNIVPLDVDLFSLADLPSLGEGEHVHPKAFARMPKPDGPAITEGCGFIKHCKETSEPISEPQWYAMLSVVGRFDDTGKAAEEYSRPIGKKHDKYTVENHVSRTEAKLKHALESSGPRTCDNISTMWEGCRTCPHYGKITSPIQIVGENTIRTIDTGFYNIVFKDGVPTKGKPNYDDLVKHFKAKHEYVVLRETRTVMVWNGTQWSEFLDIDIHGFAETNFDPTPTHSMCMEFESKLKRTNAIDNSFTIIPDALNFQNGVLDLASAKLSPHSSKRGFTYTIPYDFAPRGACKVFEKFLYEVTMGDEELGNLIAEYVGYCLSGTDPDLVQKTAVLYGDGSNGKSVLISLMRELVGSQNCTSMSPSSLSKENYRYQLMNKLFNVSGEAPSDAFMATDIFKGLVAGETVEVRKLYCEPVFWKCTTKLLFACNDLPYSNDYSYGMIRRLMIIPFEQRFSVENENLDPMMLRKLLYEKSDIIMYCLNKWQKAVERGYRFTEPDSSKQSLLEYSEYSDNVERFVTEMCCQTSDEGQIDIGTVYNMFALWCNDNNQKLISYPTFAQRFGKKVVKVYPKVEKFRPRTGEVKRSTGYRFLKIHAVSPMSIQNF